MTAKNSTSTSLSIDDLDMIWIGSFRYYIGRTTIVTHSFCESLIKNWHSIPERAQVVIKRELLEEMRRDDDDRESSKSYKSLGHDCDSAKWRNVYAYISK